MLTAIERKMIKITYNKTHLCTGKFRPFASALKNVFKNPIMIKNAIKICCYVY